MTTLPDLLQQSAAHAWLFVPTAILLGALHGLEPGHSKTMMAGFIIAIRGTITQAVLLGVTAAVSHTAVVWVVALGGQLLSRNLDAGATEPYFQLGSAVLVFGIAAWMIWRTWRGESGHDHEVDSGHTHDHALGHDHAHGNGSAGDGEPTDAHARAHAEAIERRLAGRDVTTGQIVLFGLTGGLVPCPAAITVLLLCLQLKRLTLGVVLVGCFSIGLAATMVSAGVIASISVRHLEKRWSGFSIVARRAPYLSAVLMLAIAVYMGVNGWSGLARVSGA